MSTEVKLRRGTTAQHATFTGAEAEVTFDTDKNTLVAHDGATAGGIPMAPAATTLAGYGITDGGAPDASDTVKGIIEIAVQSEMEGASSLLVAVTPGRQHFHPSAAKVWGKVTYSGGTPTLAASYNVASVTDGGAGLLTVTIDTDFSSSDYTINLSAENDTTNNRTSGYATVTAGSFLLAHFTSSSASGTPTVDPLSFSFSAFGDQ